MATMVTPLFEKSSSYDDGMEEPAAVGYSNAEGNFYFYEDAPPIVEDYMQWKGVRIALVISYALVFFIGNAVNLSMLIVCIRQWFESVRLVQTNSSNSACHISTSVTSLFSLKPPPPLNVLNFHCFRRLGDKFGNC